MKLNINAKELLALHNLLYEKFESSAGGTCYKEGDDRASADIQLHQVYNRLKACLVAALTNKASDPVDAFMAREQDKIDRLKVQNDEVKREAAEIAKDPDYFVPKGDEDYTAPDYPRRGPRGPRGNRGGNKR